MLTALMDVKLFEVLFYMLAWGMCLLSVCTDVVYAFCLCLCVCVCVHLYFCVCVYGIKYIHVCQCTFVCTFGTHMFSR